MAMKKTIHPFLTYSFCFFAFSSCDLPPEPEENAITPSAENVLADIDNSLSELIWSPDGKEIFFTTKTALKAFNISSKSIRILDSRPLRYINLQCLTSSRFLYYRTGPIDSWDLKELYRISFAGGTPQLINTNVEAYIPSPSDSIVAITSVERHTLAVANLNTGISSVVGFGTPKAFSPDERRLAYYDTSFINFYQYDISTDSSFLFPFNLPKTYLLNAIFNGRWDIEGMKIFYGTYEYQDDIGYSNYQCAILNISTGVSKTVHLQRAVWPKDPVWNVQSDRFAVKTFSCAKSFLNSCSKWYYSIEICSLQQGSSTIYSFGTTYEFNQYQLVFSPDGKSLAFFKDGSLLTFQVP